MLISLSSTRRIESFTPLALCCWLAGLPPVLAEATDCPRDAVPADLLVGKVSVRSLLDGERLLLSQECDKGGDSNEIEALSPLRRKLFVVTVRAVSLLDCLGSVAGGSQDCSPLTVELRSEAIARSNFLGPIGWCIKTGLMGRAPQASVTDPIVVPKMKI